MRIARIIAVAAFIATAGVARAGYSSPIPANNVDDFGGAAAGTLQEEQASRAWRNSSPIPRNNVDDFGMYEAPPAPAPRQGADGASSIASSYRIDDFTLFAQ